MYTSDRKNEISCIPNSITVFFGFLISKFIIRGGRRGHPAGGAPSIGTKSVLMRETGADEAAEERMWLSRFALEFWVILAGKKKGMALQLD